MKLNDITELTTEYVVVKGEKIYFDEPFKSTSSKEEYISWLDNIEVIMRDAIVIKNK